MVEQRAEPPSPQAEAHPARGNPFKVPIWGKLDEPLKARDASRMGAYVIFFVAAIASLSALLQPHASERLEGVAQLLPVWLVGYFVLKGSRLATIVACVAWVDMALPWINAPGFDPIVHGLAVLFVSLALLWGVRGAFAQARFRRSKRGTSSA
jgi:hypothetical protein